MLDGEYCDGVDAKPQRGQVGVPGGYNQAGANGKKSARFDCWLWPGPFLWLGWPMKIIESCSPVRYITQAFIDIALSDSILATIFIGFLNYLLVYCPNYTIESSLFFSYF